MTTLFKTALDELGAVLGRVDETEVDQVCKMLAQAGRIGTHGLGREGLQMRGFAMRLFHLGMPVGVVGDMTMPPLGKGDIFLASSGPGETTTVLTLMQVAKDAGATVVALTAEPHGSAAKLADVTLLIPAQTMASDRGAAKTSVLPMGSAFEGALFVLFEVMVLKLKALKNASPEEIRARHTNME
ncbi:6-phospho-3-hexuloisomerase [Mesorhizobium sp. LHD-90]|uniref:6-phospho-3-hexuloisomerase n=1 Tax=Mesorhizobium sp. LHD-90 TaxID=3071414 RepID=UPI0027DF634A|nr:6-phospho-3-hexuloisomerase [Mesorhizobium sp. LHD-90]MDQ6435000.1 6-phospho-3-hexuloisomerase [Mesorhizobium sp. LHD-90]